MFYRSSRFAFPITEAVAQVLRSKGYTGVFPCVHYLLIPSFIMKILRRQRKTFNELQTLKKKP